MHLSPGLSFQGRQPPLALYKSQSLGPSRNCNENPNADLHACVLSHVKLFAIPWIIAQQASLSMGVYRQDIYWSGLLFLSPGDLPDPRIEPTSAVAPALQADSLPLNHMGSPLILILYFKLGLFISKVRT